MSDKPKPVKLRKAYVVEVPDAGRIFCTAIDDKSVVVELHRFQPGNDSYRIMFMQVPRGEPLRQLADALRELAKEEE